MNRSEIPSGRNTSKGRIDQSPGASFPVHLRSLQRASPACADSAFVAQTMANSGERDGDRAALSRDRDCHLRRAAREFVDLVFSSSTPEGAYGAISFLVFEIYDVPHESSSISCTRSFTPMATTRRSRSSPTTSARQFIDNELDIVSRRSSRTTSAQRFIDNVLNIVSRRPSRTTSARQFVDNVPDAVSRRAARTTRRIEEAPYPP